ncbi:MAG: polyphosphate kinase 2 family protein [Pyrinomonadaceae bacterium]
MKTDKFLVREGSKRDLKKHPTDFTGDYTDKEKALKDLEKNIKRIGELQDIMYAQDEQSLLIVFQAMDAAGKDSTIEHVMTGINPQGCSVVSFKQPSSEEMDHDFLWRCTKAVPERGKIGVFNRSHYEEVLVVRVHPEILMGQKLPAKVKTDKKIWQKRFGQIRNFEDNLAENGTQIVKFFLHVSKEAQKKRFLDRIEQPDKNWKFRSGDAKERALWDDYMNAYVDAMRNTSTANAPWYVIPADRKWFMRLAVSQVIVDKLEAMKLAYPIVSEAEKADLAEAKRLLESEI